MDTSELIAQFRRYTADLTAPYLWTDEEVVDWLSEGEEEACIRGRLLFDKSTASVCSVAVSSGTSTYSLHNSVLEITHATLTPVAGSDIDLEIISRAELDLAYPGWRTSTDAPYALVHDDTSIEILPTVPEDYTLTLEVYRLPLLPLDVEPEIARVHHKFLVRWAMHRAYLKNDSDAHAAELSMRYEREFDAYFGLQARAATRIRQQKDKLYHSDLFV